MFEPPIAPLCTAVRSAPAEGGLRLRNSSATTSGMRGALCVQQSTLDPMAATTSLSSVQCALYNKARIACLCTAEMLVGVEEPAFSVEGLIPGWIGTVSSAIGASLSRVILGAAAGILHGGGPSLQLELPKYVQQWERPPGRSSQPTPPHRPHASGQHARTFRASGPGTAQLAQLMTAGGGAGGSGSGRGAMGGTGATWLRHSDRCITTSRLISRRSD